MPSNPLFDYLAQTPREKFDNGTAAYLANLSATAMVAPELARAIVQELADQRSHLKLIASENYCSLSTQLTMGSLLTDKYAEGFPPTDGVKFASRNACTYSPRSRRLWVSR